MGILRNGFYSRGYKTTEQIYDMTGMRNGDTVFDTTRKERRVYDGEVWVSGNMITKSFQPETYGSLPSYLDKMWTNCWILFVYSKWIAMQICGWYCWGKH